MIRQYIKTQIFLSAVAFLLAFCVAATGAWAALSNGANAIDELGQFDSTGAIYNATTDLWYVVSFVKGY